MMQSKTPLLPLPAELAVALKESVEAKRLFESLSLVRQREHIRRIAAAKKAKTRLDRARQCLMSLLEKVA